MRIHLCILQRTFEIRQFQRHWIALRTLRIKVLFTMRLQNDRKHVYEDITYTSNIPKQLTVQDKHSGPQPLLYVQVQAEQFKPYAIFFIYFKDDIVLQH